jgi:hypothetical protein
MDEIDVIDLILQLLIDRCYLYELNRLSQKSTACLKLY